MIFKRENFIEEKPDDEKYPARQIEQLIALDGSSTRFIGRVSLGLQTPMGVQSVPVIFEIQAGTVTEAFAKFEVRAEEEIEKTQRALEEQFQKLRRKEQSRIVTLDEIAPGGISKLQI